MSPAALYWLEWGKLFLASPVMAALTAIAFFALFRTPIGELISKIEELKVFGGQVITQTANAAAAPPLPINASPNEPLAAPEITTIAAVKEESWQAKLVAQREAAYLWEYRFLNLFLVRVTQEVLEWLAMRSTPATYETYDVWLSDRVTDPQERQVILNALRNHHLVHVNDTLIQVTPKGHEYRQWRGPLLRN